MQLANGKASYKYDGLGRRVMAYGVDGSTTYQMYSQDGQLLARRTDGGPSNSSRTIQIYLAGKAIAETNGTTGTAYFYTDALGSTIASTRTVPAVVAFSCPAGWSLAGNTCSQGTTSTQPATVAGYNCPAGYTLSGSICSQTTDTTSPATANYSCPAGWTLSGTNCSSTTSAPATPVYACPAGFTLSGSTCSGTSSVPASISWDCKGNGSLQPLSWSPSGYYCFSRTVNKEVAVDGCSDLTPAGLTYLGWRQNGTYTAACYFGPAPVYYCQAGATLSGTNCITPVSQAASVISYTCSTGTLSGSSCLSTITSGAQVSYSCPSGQTLSGTTCHAVSSSTLAGTPYYSCPAGYTLAGSTCSQQGTATMAATASFACPSGTLSGGSCLNALARTRYEPYGNTAAGTVPNGIGFTGHVNDANTGLVYMQQRYYDPVAGRFVSTDALPTDANTGERFNRYEYANLNPYRFTDPDGNDSWGAETHETVKTWHTGSNIPQTTTLTSIPGGPTSITTSGPMGSLSLQISGPQAEAHPTAAVLSLTSATLGGVARNTTLEQASHNGEHAKAAFIAGTTAAAATGLAIGGNRLYSKLSWTLRFALTFLRGGDAASLPAPRPPDVPPPPPPAIIRPYIPN
jgi:RHS repeat-associated protein